MTAERRDAVIIAGHRGDRATVEAARHDPDGAVRVAVLGALERLGALDDDHLAAALVDPDQRVRRRAAESAAHHPGVDLYDILADDDPSVVEIAAWACGERPGVDDRTLERLIDLATGADDALVRESAAAALGALGDERGVAAIIAACGDKPAVRRRAVLALAPFLPAADDAIDDDGRLVLDTVWRALADRDWQVRQAAEDLLTAAGHPLPGQ